MCKTIMVSVPRTKPVLTTPTVRRWVSRNRSDPRTAGLEICTVRNPSEIYAQWDAKEAGQAKESA